METPRITEITEEQMLDLGNNIRELYMNYTHGELLEYSLNN